MHRSHAFSQRCSQCMQQYPSSEFQGGAHDSTSKHDTLCRRCRSYQGQNEEDDTGGSGGKKNQLTIDLHKLLIDIKCQEQAKLNAHQAVIEARHDYDAIHRKSVDALNEKSSKQATMQHNNTVIQHTEKVSHVTKTQPVAAQTKREVSQANANTMTDHDANITDVVSKHDHHKFSEQRHKQSSQPTFMQHHIEALQIKHATDIPNKSSKQSDAVVKYHKPSHPTSLISGQLFSGESIGAARGVLKSVKTLKQVHSSAVDTQLQQK